MRKLENFLFYDGHLAVIFKPANILLGLLPRMTARLAVRYTNPPCACYFKSDSGKPHQTPGWVAV